MGGGGGGTAGAAGGRRAGERTAEGAGVGAGPVGLMMANYLGRMCISELVVEKLATLIE
ncbi:FAD-dependent monooxygenase, partial [Klebsiella pneumoniae]|uniref:FAD-dependent monooxygenase n=1 Tax=Klebsiella pneumoniae TaxID=573 RepID=UPI0016038FA9